MTGSTSQAAEVQILVLSGPSGSGKTTIVNRLIAESPVKLVKAVSATTRPPRTQETDGDDYYFLSAEEFERKRQSGDFLECAEVFGAGYWYGTLRSELDRAKQAGGWAFLEIDVQGALNVMNEFPDAVTVFLTTSSEQEYEKRLRARGTDSEDAITRRLATARRELNMAGRYRHRVVNDDLDRAVREICDILAREHSGK